MTYTVSRLVLAAFVSVQLAALPGGAYAQTNEQKPPDQKAQSGDRKDAAPRRVDEIAEVGRQLAGPAANPECVWLGRRVVSLLWRDDLDTAFRHLDLYDRFGCPGGHIQATFRCLVRLPDNETKMTDALKAADALNARIQACWINPSLQPPPAAPAAAAAPEAGTTNR